MSPVERGELWERLSVIGRMVKLQLIVTWAVRLLLLGLVFDALWLTGARFLPYIVPASVLPAIPLGLAALGALILTFWRPSPAQLALAVDRRLGLQERLVTAVELQRVGMGEGGMGKGHAGESLSPVPHPPSPALAGLQLSDAVAHLRRVEPLDAFPIRLSLREVNAALGLAALVVALVVIPNSMEQTVRQRDQVQQTIRQEAERLNKLAEEVARLNLEEPGEDLQQIEQALREGAKALEERSGNSEEALAALAALEQRLQALQGQSGADLDEALSALAGSLAQDPATRPLGTALAKGDYKKAAEELRRLAEQIDNLSANERARLARSMRQAGQRASRANPALAQSLAQTGNALEQGGTGESQQAMNNAAGQLERASGQLRAGSQRERAMAQTQQSRGTVSRSAQQAQGRNQSAGRQQGQQGQQGQRSGGQGQQGEDGMDGQGQSQGQQGDPQSGDRPGGSAAGTGTNPNPRSEEIYDPAFASSRQERLNQDQPFEPTESLNNPNPEDAFRNDAQVSYSQVHARYQEKAVQSLENTYIPVGMKDLVKEYFSSLTPGR